MYKVYKREEAVMSKLEKNMFDGKYFSLQG